MKKYLVIDAGRYNRKKIEEWDFGKRDFYKCERL